MRVKSNLPKNQSLSGQRIVVTRPREQAGDFAQKLAKLGADVLEIPAIKIVPITRKQDIVDMLLGLNTYNWLVFTSANGVTAFFDLFFKRFQDLRDLGGARIAAVGPATAAKIHELHLQVDLMPDEFVGAKIAEAMAKFESVENLKICLLRAEDANPDLPRALEELGAIVDDIAVYKTVAETEDPAGAGTVLLENGADWITFTSGSAVEHFHARFDLPKLLKKFPRMKLASIGPETSKAIRALKMKPALEAKKHTTDGLIADLLRVMKM
jgi:uroporphyrinogen III methyltransferase/synthase